MSYSPGSGGAGGIPPTWAIGTTYSVGQTVTDSGTTYISVTNSNVGNDPTLDTDNANWMGLYPGYFADPNANGGNGFSKTISGGVTTIAVQPLAWDSSATYLLGQTVTGTDHNVYMSIVNGNNTNHNPVGDNNVHWTQQNGSLISPMNTQGDMLYGDVGGVPTRLAAGTAGQVLTQTSGGFDKSVNSDGTHVMASGSDSGLASGTIVNGGGGTLGAFTVEWVGKMPTTGANNGVWYWGDFAVSDGDLTCGVQNSGNLWLHSAAGAPGNWVWAGVVDGNPHLWTFVYDGNSNLILYVDGVSQGSKAWTSATTTITLAGMSLSADSVGNCLATNLERWSYYSAALSSTRVTAHHTAYTQTASDYNTVVLSDSPLRNYAMQESSGTTCTDTGSAGVNLTYGTTGITLGATGFISASGEAPGWAGDTVWTNVQGGVGFTNSWVDAGGAAATTAFRKDATGRVEFRCSMKSGASASVAFTFPAGYRPAATQTFCGLAELVASDVPVELAIAAAGTATVTFVGSLTGNVYVTGSFWNGQ